MAEVDNKQTSPGQLLIAARKKAKLSVDDVADRLNLSVRVIFLLENDEYNDEIPDAFLRGYLRTYARAMSLDEDEIVSLYTGIIGSKVVKNYYIPSADAPPASAQHRNQQLWIQILVAVVFIAIAALGWILYKKFYSETPIDQSGTPIETSESSKIELSAQQSLPPEIQVTSTTLDNDSQTSATDSMVNNDDASELSNSETSNSELSDSEASDALNTNETASDTSAALNVDVPQGFIDNPVLQDAELAFQFIDDCWVQVTDNNGEVLAVGLKTAGRRFNVSGVPPISVVLGKPRAVALQYNNQAVDLSVYPANQTARFTLGEPKTES